MSIKNESIACGSHLKDRLFKSVQLVHDFQGFFCSLVKRIFQVLVIWSDLISQEALKETQSRLEIFAKSMRVDANVVVLDFSAATLHRLALKPVAVPKEARDSACNRRNTMSRYRVRETHELNICTILTPRFVRRVSRLVGGNFI